MFVIKNVIHTPTQHLASPCRLVVKSSRCGSLAPRSRKFESSLGQHFYPTIYVLYLATPAVTAG
jgi:hypothetical protein